MRNLILSSTTAVLIAVPAFAQDNDPDTNIQLI